MKLLELTDREHAVVMRMREEDEKEKRQQAIFLSRINTLYNYSLWLSQNGVGSTFSTFCDDFGYEPLYGEEDRGETYKILMNARRVIREEVTE
jgi:hypothetical protein